MIQKSRNFFQSLGFAAAGILYACRTQRNIRYHSLAALAALLLGFFLAFSRQEMVLLILTVVLVISLEMVNTAVETVVDLYTEEYFPLAKIAKDVAAGAVLLASLGALLVALFLFGPRLLALLLSILFSK